MIFQSFLQRTLRSLYKNLFQKGILNQTIKVNRGEKQMTHEEFMALPIKSVKEEEQYPGDPIRISFTIQRFTFYIYVDRLENDSFFPSGIFHMTGPDGCPACGKESEPLCDGLKPHLHALFQRLINTNTLRLPWLYREYKVK